MDADLNSIGFHCHRICLRAKFFALSLSRSHAFSAAPPISGLQQSFRPNAETVDNVNVTQTKWFWVAIVATTNKNNDFKDLFEAVVCCSIFTNNVYKQTYEWREETRRAAKGAKEREREPVALMD